MQNHILSETEVCIEAQDQSRTQMQYPVDGNPFSFMRLGRGRLVAKLAHRATRSRRILEVGCGTGRNLELICSKFPGAEITAVDTSPSMLRAAGEKLNWRGELIDFILWNYAEPISGRKGKFDIIIFSYCLSAVGPGWSSLVSSACKDLSRSGLIGVVDFHCSPFPSFTRWMEKKQVHMSNQILPHLHMRFNRYSGGIGSGYFGLWQYFDFIGSLNQ